MSFYIFKDLYYILFKVISDNLMYFIPNINAFLRFNQSVYF